MFTSYFCRNQYRPLQDPLDEVQVLVRLNLPVASAGLLPIPLYRFDQKGL